MLTVRLCYMCSIQGYRVPCMASSTHDLFHALVIPRVTIARVIIPRVTIPRVAQDELHKTCIFHATRKRGPCSHVTG